MSPALGDNINGPAVIRAPAWIRHPLGRYYLYFAHHQGSVIRLAVADDLAGPWKIYEPGVLDVKDTAFFRPQPDPKETVAAFFYTHVASPEVHVDLARKRLLMWFHGWWTDGERWPSDPAEARAWAMRKGYAQFTQVAESTDGIHFTVRPAITKQSYLRVFLYGGYFYGLSRLGQLARTVDPLETFDIGPNPFRDQSYADRVRHVAPFVRGSRLYVFFTAIGDAPERLLMSTIDLTADWSQWRATPPIEVLRPMAAYECTGIPVTPSKPGEAEGPEHAVRDPGVIEDRGRLLVFYSYCGEQGIAAADVTSFIR
jgi:hypothetical protein